MKTQDNMEYTHPTTEGGSPLPLTGYSSTWPIEMYLGYSFEDLIQKFGYRIQDAIRTPLYHGKTGLDEQTMKNKTKWWKFWNHDIRKAYMWYTGEVYNDENIKFSNYINNPNPTVPPSEVFPTLAPEHPFGLQDHSFKQKIIIPIEKKRKSGKTRVQETLVMDHIKQIETKKRKPKLHQHTFEFDGGPCTKCGITVAEMIDNEITNYNKKHGKSK